MISLIERGLPGAAAGRVLMFAALSLVVATGCGEEGGSTRSTTAEYRPIDEHLSPLNTLGLPNVDLGAAHPEQYYVAGDVRTREARPQATS